MLGMPGDNANNLARFAHPRCMKNKSGIAKDNVLERWWGQRNPRRATQESSSSAYPEGGIMEHQLFCIVVG